MKDFPQAAIVRDTEDNEFATKRVLAVPKDSTAIVESTDVRDKLQRYAEDMRELVVDGSKRYVQLAETIERTRPGLGALLRREGISPNAFTAMFPEILTRNGWRISAA